MAVLTPTHRGCNSCTSIAATRGSSMIRENKTLSQMANYSTNLSALSEHLDPDESVLASCWGCYETKSLGTDTLKNGILVVTEKRVILYGKRFSGFNLETFPYDKISAIELSKGFLGKKISVKMSGNETTLKYIKTGDGDPDAVVSKAKELMECNSSNSILKSSGESDIIEQIRKLAELKDAGILSESEFDAKKSELLSRI